MTRRFEFKQGSSSKFWEIALSDDGSTTVTFGRIGTKGQSKTKVHDDDDEAAAFFDKMIASKLEEGYVEVASSGVKRPAATESVGTISFTDKPPYSLFKLSDLSYRFNGDGIELRFDTLPPGPAHDRSNKKKKKKDDDDDDEEEEEDDWFSKDAWDNYGPAVSCSEGTLKPLHYLAGDDKVPIESFDDLSELTMPYDVVFDNDYKTSDTSTVSFSCCDHQFTKDNVITFRKRDADTGALTIDWRGTIVMDSDEGKELNQPHGFWLQGVARREDDN